jgi:recombinational DNA repair protein RecR
MHQTLAIQRVMIAENPTINGETTMHIVNICGKNGFRESTYISNQ